jgi:hypothetical protein
MMKAIEVSRYITLSENAKKLLTPEMPATEFIDLLAAKQFHTDAVQFIAHYLPKRQAVWWALTCVKQAGTEFPPEQETALKSAERWIAEPTEENRQATLKAADAADTMTPAGMTALAAYYSDGMPASADPNTNAKAYFMTAKLVSGAVMLSAATDAEQLQARFSGFTGKGIEVVKRTRA